MCDRRQRRDGQKGGTYYPMTVKKHLRAQEIASQNRILIHFISSIPVVQTCRTKTTCLQIASTLVLFFNQATIVRLAFHKSPW